MGFRGGNRGGRGGRGGGRGGSRGPGKSYDQGPPEEVVEFGTLLHECEGQLVVKSIIDKVPFFNAPIYLKNIEPIGKVDEILGAINEYLVSIQLNENYKASSFEKDQKLYIDPRKLLPLDRFIPKPPQPKESKKRKSNSDNRGVKKFRDDRGNNRGRGGFGNFSRGGGNNRNSGGFSGGFSGGRGGRGQGSFNRGGGGGNRSGSFGRGGSRKF